MPENPPQEIVGASVASFQVPPPEKFSFKAEEWQKWIRRFERFRKATALDKKDEESQVSTLIYTMGEEADDIFVSFELSTEQAKKYDTVRSKFEDKFTLKRNWSKVCRATKSKPGRLLEVDDTDSELFLGEVIDAISVTTGELKTVLQLNGNPVQFKIDTGADVTVITENTYKNTKPQQSLQHTSKALMGPCKYKMTCVGVFKPNIYASSTDKNTIEQVYVIKDLERNLLSRTAAVKLGLISLVNAVNKDHYGKSIEEKYPELFLGLGHMKDEYTYKITLEENAQPYSLSVPRKVALPLYENTKKELDRMLKSGVISKVDQPTEWCAPMVVRPKSNDKVRICVDLTALNRYVKRENHPLPAIDTTLAKLSDASVFSKLDANSGFWQTPLAEESRHLTTFITPWGRFMFNVLPYGISSGSEKFQKNMNMILEGLDGVECSIDDAVYCNRLTSCIDQ